MRTIDRETSALLVMDFQARLMPVIDSGAAAVANARRLLAAADMLRVPALFTEQNAGGLGGTIAELEVSAHGDVLHKMTFDACRAEGIAKLPDRPEVVVAGCEAHICVLQTVLGLLDIGRRVYVVQDAIGSRQPDSKAAAIQRMAHHGAEIVTTEMAVFEWLATADHPRFRDVARLIK